MRFVFLGSAFWVRAALAGVSLVLVYLSFASSSDPVAGAQPQGGILRLSLRTQVQPFKGSDAWEEIVLARDIPARETAILICDMWDRHWCLKASARCDALAMKMVPVLKTAALPGGCRSSMPRPSAWSSTRTRPARRILETPRVTPPAPLALTDPPLPVDDSDGGCDDDPPAKTYKAWTRENAAIPIADEDVISDNGPEIYSFLRQRGIKNLILMGVHTNMCICNRSFGIKQMTRWGIRCILVRDLTDAMFNPKMKPFVSHEEGTELVIRHIEKYWCPSIESCDFSGGRLP